MEVVKTLSDMDALKPSPVVTETFPEPIKLFVEVDVTVVLVYCAVMEPELPSKEKILTVGSKVSALMTNEVLRKTILAALFGKVKLTVLLTTTNVSPLALKDVTKKHRTTRCPVTVMTEFDNLNEPDNAITDE